MAAFFSVAAAKAQPSDNPHAPAATSVIILPSDITAEAPAETAGTGAVTKIEQRWAAAATLSGIIASLFGIFGANRILQFVANLGSWFGSGAKKTARSTYKAAKSVARATGQAGANLVRKPVRWVFLAASLTIFVFTGVAVFDLEWQAGLLTGAGATGAAVYGLDKTKAAFKNVMKISPFRWRQSSTTPA